MAENIRKISVATQADAGLQTFYGHVFAVMAFGLAITGSLAYFAMSSPEVMSWFVSNHGTKEASLTWTYIIVALVELGLVFLMSSWIAKNDLSPTTGLTVFTIYAGLNGLAIAPVVDLYTTTSVAKVFFITAATFGTCALYGYTTKRDLKPFGTFLLMGLIGLIIAMIVNMFLRSPAMDFIICSVGVLLFAGLTAWDMQMLRELYRNGGKTVGLVINGALALYLDFLNMFLFILQLLGVKKD
jgi:uncharacterized protein